MHCWVYMCARRCLQWRTITHFPLCKRSADLRVGHCSYTSPLLLHPTFRSSAGECVSPPSSERASAAAVPTTPTNTLELFFALVAALSRHFLRLRNRAEKSSGASGRKSIKLMRGRFGVFGLASKRGGARWIINMWRVFLLTVERGGEIG
jgi:hypothetical protein